MAGLGSHWAAWLRSLAHGFIDEEADDFGEAVRALFIEELQNGIQEFRIA